MRKKCLLRFKISKFFPSMDFKKGYESITWKK